MADSLHRAPQWGTWRGFVYWDFERQRKEGSGNGASIMKLIWALFFGTGLC